MSEANDLESNSKSIEKQSKYKRATPSPYNSPVDPISFGNISGIKEQRRSTHDKTVPSIVEMGSMRQQPSKMPSFKYLDPSQGQISRPSASAPRSQVSFSYIDDFDRNNIDMSDYDRKYNGKEMHIGEIQNMLQKYKDGKYNIYNGVYIGGPNAIKSVNNLLSPEEIVNILNTSFAHTPMHVSPQSLEEVIETCRFCKDGIKEEDIFSSEMETPKENLNASQLFEVYRGKKLLPHKSPFTSKLQTPMANSPMHTNEGLQSARQQAHSNFQELSDLTNPQQSMSKYVNSQASLTNQKRDEQSLVANPISDRVSYRSRNVDLTPSHKLFEQQSGISTKAALSFSPN